MLSPLVLLDDLRVGERGKARKISARRGGCNWDRYKMASSRMRDGMARRERFDIVDMLPG